MYRGHLSTFNKSFMSGHLGTCLYLVGLLNDSEFPLTRLFAASCIKVAGYYSPFACKMPKSLYKMVCCG